MTGRCSVTRTSLCLVALLLSCLSGSNLFVAGAPEPIPPEYNDNFSDYAENLLLLNRLKLIIEQKENILERERELSELRMTIQTIMEARAKMRNQNVDYSAEEPEILPIPSAVVNQTPQQTGKRTGATFMSLCHFKICNMGRKRQL
ncbi:hypothetical protein KM043_018304 [Ampulex compressa]|nr:hypothetical protein KM043_018304 [Ampulex compressa]